MNYIKLLHTADIHLKKLNDDIYETFTKIISLIKREEIEYLLIPGDLFDDLAPEDKLVDKVIELFEYINPCKVLISPGNHDPLTFGSPYLTKNWPRNVYIFKEALSSITFNNIRFYGRAFTGHFEETPLLPRINIDNNYINILVMHGDVSSTSQYNPISLNLLKEIGFDYCALGHIHKPILNNIYTYPGIPEGRGFDEVGTLGVVLVSISDRVKTEFIPINTNSYIIKEIDISNLRNIDTIAHRINEECSKSTDYYRVILKGRVEFTPDTKLLTSLLSPYYSYIEILDETIKNIDFEKLKKENSLKGIFVRHMLDKISKTPENKVLEDSLLLGVKAFDEDIEV